MAKEGRDNPIALLKYVSDMPKFFKEKLGKPRESTSDISNIGVYRPKEGSEGPWSIGRMAFSQTPNLTSSPFGVNIVTGGDGNAVVNFSWTEGAVEKELMAEVVDGFEKGVESLIKGQED